MSSQVGCLQLDCLAPELMNPAAALLLLLDQLAGHNSIGRDDGSPCLVHSHMACSMKRLGSPCFAACNLRPAADGMRWPALAAHLAARYRQAVAQRQLGIELPENAAELLQPCDRRLLCAANMAGELLWWAGVHLL